MEPEYGIPGAGFLSLVPSPLPADDLVFPDGESPESGKLTLGAEAVVAPCVGVGLDADAVAENDSFLELTVTGGAVEVAGEDAAGEPFGLDPTTWDELS